MPASVCDPVSNALHLSLAKDDSQSASLLDSRIYSSTKSVVLAKIDFEEAGDYRNNVLDLKSKYVVIRHKKPALENNYIKKDVSSFSTSTEKQEDGVPKAKRVLFSVDKIEIGWDSKWTVGAGMQNVGNTCYLNSTLQALFHVSAVANWLYSESVHANSCTQDGCIICAVRSTLIAAQKSGGPIKPWQVYSKLRIICKHLLPGRQEDAHEFLRYLVEAIEKAYLSRFPHSDKFDQYTKETTPMNQILGGYLRSTVRCAACQHTSVTYQHFQDLLLDIKHITTLEEALDSYFSRERLEDLGYKCSGCHKKVSATKQFYIERAPMVLCIALKRFSLVGGKLSKHVQFRKKISLNKFMHNQSNKQPLTYKLVSIVNHLGSSQNCGHYTAIGQAPNNNYYQFDDSSVRPLPLSAVLHTNAYVMFYEREVADSTPAPSATTSSVVYGPQLPNNLRDRSPLRLTYTKTEDAKSLNEPVNKPVNKPIILNSTLSKPEASTSNSEPYVVKQNGEVERKVNGVKEEKISFVIKQPDEYVYRIKNGFTPILRTPEKQISKLVKPPKSPLEKLEEQMNKNEENHSQKNGNGNTNGVSKLVPYDSESDDEETTNGAWSPKPTRTASTAGLVIASRVEAWEVSSENKPSLLSPSLNGVTTKQVKEKEETVISNGTTNGHTNGTAENDSSPNTTVSTLSPLSAGEATSRPNSPRGPATSVQTALPPANTVLASHETLRSLQTMSHRGYGAPVATWAGTHSHMNRQVFEERRDERKRAHEGVDEMDRGRVKKVKKFHPCNRYNNDRNGYNPFQDKQNKQNWGGNGGGFKYRNDRRPQHHYNHKPYNNKYKRFNNNRYNNNNGNHHYSRHH